VLVVVQTVIVPMVGDEGADAGPSAVVFDGGQLSFPDIGTPATKVATTLCMVLALVGLIATVLAAIRTARRSVWRAAAGLVTIALALALFVLFPLVGHSAELRARPGKAIADVRTLADSVEMYRTTTGALPGSLTDLTSAKVSPPGQAPRPIGTVIPSAPSGWTPYRYESRADGTFRLESRRVGPPRGR